MDIFLSELKNPADEWPTVPEEQRPKSLYHMGNFPEEATEAFAKKGWTLVDIRLMPADTHAERKDVVNAILAGFRVGSIPYDDNLAKVVTLEGQFLGLGKSKDSAPKKEPVKPGSSLANVLDFGKNPSNLGGKTASAVVKKRSKK